MNQERAARRRKQALLRREAALYDVRARGFKMTIETAQPALMTRASLELPTPYVAPDGKLETEIAKIFADVLRIDEVGANDDFFDIGGDSLGAEAMSLEILKRTGCEFPISSFLDYSSPRKIASALAKSANGKDAAKAPIAADTTARPPIFVVHGRRGFTMPAPRFLQALAEGQKLRMFELPGAGENAASVGRGV